MRHRDRVAMALAGEEPDRCPMQISFTPEFARRLRENLGIEGTLNAARGGEHNPLGGGNTHELERAIGVDLILTSVGWAGEIHHGAGDYTDEWGVGWREQAYETRYGSGHYTEMVVHPLADEGAIGSYRAPDPLRPELYDDARTAIRAFGDEYWIVGVTQCTAWETAWALRGFERLLMDLVEDPDLVDQILELPFRYHLAAAERLATMGVDMIWAGDDVGTQRGMLVAPALWRRHLKVRMAEFVTRVKVASPSVYIAYHSDGDIREIIDDLVEIGIDILNPIQPACMDPAQLKRRYGDRLAFWGSLDEQHTLPFGSPSDVRAEILHRLSTVGRGGRLILGPTHHVQLDTPMENFWAMVDTIRETAYVPGHGPGSSS
jgi:uroporphyrinogen decarboxylase